jgi:SAM-dependent methyltransferase
MKNRESNPVNLNDQVAEAYNEHGRKYHEARKGTGLFFNEFLEVPATLSLIPNNLNNVTVFDAGCGSGLYSVRLAQRGAKVFGIDLSETMIQIAEEEKPADLNISYQVGDICETRFESATFDMIVSNYVLENVADLDEAFSEFGRLLKKNGTLLFSVSHPIRAMADRQIKDGFEFWTLNQYFTKGTRDSDFGNGLKVIKFKYTLSDYINAAAAAGFLIEKLYEPQPIAAGQLKDPLSYEVSMRLPQLMILKLKRS